MRGLVIVAAAALVVGCQAEPDASSSLPTPSASAQASAVATTTVPVPDPAPSATQLGAVALPDTKACVSQCREKRKPEAISGDAVEAACRAQCAKECLDHCRQQRGGMPDFETVCARDCGVQQQLLR